MNTNHMTLTSLAFWIRDNHGDNESDPSHTGLEHHTGLVHNHLAATGREGLGLCTR